MHRRDFITDLGGAAASCALWPLAARAQQGERVRRVAGLFLLQAQENRGLGLWEELAKLGWIEGRNLRIDLRYAPAADLDRMQAYAMELVSLDPDVIVTGGTVPARVMQQQTRTIPIIFIAGGSAEIGGVVRNISRPEGNITGISGGYLSIAGKWLQLLKEAAPRLARVAMIFYPEGSAGMREGGVYRAPIEAAATLSGVQPIWIPFHTAAELERGIAAFAAEPNGGLIPAPALDDWREVHRLALQYRVPAIYWGARFAREGGLMSYGASGPDSVRQWASYVDRILHGAKPGDLPVQCPTKFELVINLKTARAIGLEIPATLIARADEVIE
jgi:putative ABC transport system substrate-binding protein